MSNLKVWLQNLKWFVALFPIAACGQATNEVPPLRPPLAEIPPTVWEQYGIWIWLGITVGSALVTILILWWLQPKPVQPEPIETRTRKELEALRQRPVDGAMLSSLSQSVRRYYCVAFELSAEELTTSEFALAADQSGVVGGELAAAVAAFLRRLDAEKFSPAKNGAAGEAWGEAWQLFERGEARRAELRAKANPS